MPTYTGAVYDADMRVLAVIRGDNRDDLEMDLVNVMACYHAESVRVWRHRRPTWPRHPGLLRVYPPRAWGLPSTVCPAPGWYPHAQGEPCPMARNR